MSPNGIEGEVTRLPGDPDLFFTYEYLTGEVELRVERQGNLLPADGIRVRVFNDIGAEEHFSSRIERPFSDVVGGGGAATVLLNAIAGP